MGPGSSPDPNIYYRTTSKCGANERRRRRLDGAAHLFSPIPGRKRKRVPSGVPGRIPSGIRPFYFSGLEHSNATVREREHVKKVVCRGDHWSPADFASQNLFAARRKYGYFPSGNPKNTIFRREGQCPAPTVVTPNGVIGQFKSRSNRCGSYSINPSKFHLFCREWHRREFPSPPSQSPAGRWCRRSARRGGRSPGRRGWSSR